MSGLARPRRDLGAFAEAVGYPLTPWQRVAFGLVRRTTDREP